MDGILNVCKPSGPTSHDIVAIVRRLSRQKRVGHAGTLDPAACGVLIVCLGRATRLLEYMSSHDKEYYAAVRFGFATDTYDATGRPAAPPRPCDFDEAELRTALTEFTGPLEQVPPAYSAIKVGGQPAYRLARADQAVELAPRQVAVHAFELLAWHEPVLLARVHCSKGTYVRSLAHDLGQRLGCGAHLAGLMRSASGPFGIEDSVSLEELGQAAAEGYLDAFMRAPDEAVLEHPALILGEQAVQAIRNGQRHQGPPAPAGESICRAYDAAGQLVAVMSQDEAPGSWQPKKVLALDD